MLGFKLSEEDVAALDKLNENIRMVVPPWFFYAPHKMADESDG